MAKKYFKSFHLVFLFIFLLLNLIINFFHCEKNVRSRDFCPACHFQSSTLTTTSINFFHIPQLHFIEILKTFESVPYQEIFLNHPNSRSPPQI